MEGTVFDIQRFSVNDGPGIRTTVFFKGCPLKCRWCHNPEGKHPALQVRYLKNKCMGCGKCAALTGEAPQDRAGRVLQDELTGRATAETSVAADGAPEAGGAGGFLTEDAKDREAARICPTKAYTISGKRMTPEEVVDTALRDELFYREEGGVTFSGGEPTMQPEFLNACMDLAHEKKLHVTLDTSGLCESARFLALCQKADLVLYDIKGVTPEKHLEFTGVDNALILKNFEALLATDKPIWVRVPLMTEYTADPEELERIFAYLKPFAKRIGKLTLIPYHSFGNVKYATVNDSAEEFTPISDEDLALWENKFREAGFYVAK